MTSVDHFTPVVGARADLAKAIKDRFMSDATAVGLTAADLDAIVTSGEAAREADRLQHEELAGIDVERSGKKATAKDIFAREHAMRDRLTAVVADLEAGHADLAAWLSALSFARYRLRELAPPAPAAGAAAGAPAAAADPAVRKVERVTKEDIPTRLSQLANFCAAILAAGREPIVDAFAARGLTRALLTALHDDADALAHKGRNVPRGAGHTSAEADAVAAQRKAWSRTSRMIHKVARGKDELHAMLVDSSGH